MPSRVLLKKNTENPMPIKNYKQDNRNANRGTDRGRDELRQSLKRLGAGRSVLVDKNGVAIAGNKTLEAATELGLTKTVEVETDGNTLVVVKRIDLDLETDIKAREMAFADNKIGQDNLDWDPEILKTDLALLDSDFLAKLWTDDDLGELFETESESQAVTEDEPPIDKANELQAKWQVSPGDLWIIGEHRLICGDCTDKATVARLMGGEKADLVFTDPPYGIKVVGKNGLVGGMCLCKNGIYEEIIGDDTTETAKLFYQICISLGFKNFIIWGGNYFTDFLPPTPCWIVWDKRGDMSSNTFADGEVAWTSFSSPLRIKRQVWCGMIKEGESGKRFHPTQKPIRLFQELISEYSIEGIIYDPFLGSGTTMVAAHQTGRRCYGLEIAPGYCAVILERMSKLGLNPIKS